VCGQTIELSVRLVDRRYIRGVRVMTRYNQIFYFILLTALVLCFARMVPFAQATDNQKENGTNSSARQPMPNRMEFLRNNEGIVLLFGFYHSWVINEAFVPKMVVWDDGRVLYGRFIQDATTSSFDNNYSRPINVKDLQYSWGQTDVKKAEEFAMKIRDFFRFDESGGSIYEVARESSYWALCGIVDGAGAYIVRQMVPHNASERPVRGSGDRQPLMISQFLEAWEKAKNGANELGELVVKEGAVNVKVVVKEYEMTVLSENDEVLAHVSKMPIAVP